MKLTDTHLVLLSAAAQRDDRALERPAELDASSAAKIATKLLGGGLVEEIEATGTIATWRDADDTSIALRITDAGLKAIGVDADANSETVPALPDERPRIVVNAARGKSRRVTSVGNDIADPNAKRRRPNAQGADGEAGRKPHKGKKIEQVIGLLKRKRGATIQEMVEATNWLPHTTRAVLTGLRKRGHVLERQAAADKPSVYRIVDIASSNQQVGVAV